MNLTDLNETLLSHLCYIFNSLKCQTYEFNNEINMYVYY